MTCQGGEKYGLELRLRSMEAIKKGEEVTISYLQEWLKPKNIRQEELWWFHCHCKRCTAEPTTYVDSAIQAVYVLNPNNCPENISNPDYYRDEAAELRKSFHDVILQFHDPNSGCDAMTCCEKLENLLSHHCLVEHQVEPRQKLKLHPFHHVSLDAYVTLALAYDDLSALDSGIDRHEAFNMCRKSAAYSLLVAGAIHHLFIYESSLMAHVESSGRKLGNHCKVLLNALHGACFWNRD